MKFGLADMQITIMLLTPPSLPQGECEHMVSLHNLVFGWAVHTQYFMFSVIKSV